MIIRLLAGMALRPTKDVALPVRFAYRMGHALVRYPVWVLRRLAYRMGTRGASAPRVGIHTVFIAKENILFLKEWLLYHKYMGVEHFFLYDNSGGAYDNYGSDRYWKGAPKARFERNRMNKYGIPYDDIVSLYDADVADVLDHIRLEIPNVHIVSWQPTDSEGRVKFAQVEAQNDALKRFGPTVDWMVFMDVDEFLVSDQPIPETARELDAGGYDGGMMYAREMTSRFDHLDRYVTETTLTFRNPPPAAPKYICKPSRTWYVMVHRFISLGRRYEFSERELFFLHYKLPSSHPDVRGTFEERDNGIAPEWLAAVRASGGPYCGPEWKLSAANPEWKRIMERNEWRPPTNA